MGPTRPMRSPCPAGAPAAWVCRIAAGVAAAAALTAAPARAADDFPPPLPGPSAQPVPPAAGEPAPAPASAASSPAASAAEAPEQPKPGPSARIEQKHVGRRVSEVVVTPAGFTYHYTMTHLDDQEAPRTPLQPHQELSVPNLIHIDF